MLDSQTHFCCPGCNRLVLKGSSLCRVCGQAFKSGDPKPCALCLEFKDLKRSHAIPNSSFIEIFNGGQGITVTDDIDTYAKRNNDSWWTRQLCNECEQHLNQSYEKYSLSFLRGGKGEKIEYTKGNTFSEVDIEKIQLFFLSIFWRAVNSEEPAYNYVFIPEPWNDQLREYINKKQPTPLNLATVKISCLTYKGKRDDRSERAVKGIIIKPFIRFLPYRLYAFCFLLEGFFIEIFTPGFGFKREGILNPKNNNLFVPYVDVYDIPEVIQTIKIGIMKGFKNNKKKK